MVEGRAARNSLLTCEVQVILRKVLRISGYAAVRVLTVLIIIAAITLLCFRFVPVNATTAALTYLVAILMIATKWGLTEAISASLAAVLCFNFFFLPPIGRLNVADPENWVASFAFLATSITASQLSSRAKQRALEAVARQRDTEQLYALSHAILTTDMSQGIAEQVACHIVRIFQCRAVAIHDRNSGETCHAGSEDLGAFRKELREAAIHEILFRDETTHTIVTSIRRGGVSIGGLAIRDVKLSDTALRALASLVANGLERARGQEAANRAEAARQSEELKSTLLDAIAHEFKTPLTAIKAASTGLLSVPALNLGAERELITIVDEEADHLNTLVTQAIQVARIEAGDIELSRKLHAVADLVPGILRRTASMTDGRAVTLQIADNLPLIHVDAALIGLAIQQLIDNAARYSQAGSPLTVAARAVEGDVTISVKDEGPGVPEHEQKRIFEKFYRGPQARHNVTGTGMGLSIAREIVRAHAGKVWVASAPGQGAEFCISIPAVPNRETNP